MLTNPSFFGQPGFMFFWVKHGLAIPSGCFVYFPHTVFNRHALRFVKNQPLIDSSWGFQSWERKVQMFNGKIIMDRNGRFTISLHITRN